MVGGRGERGWWGGEGNEDGGGKRRMRMVGGRGERGWWDEDDVVGGVLRRMM